MTSNLFYTIKEKLPVNIDQVLPDRPQTVTFINPYSYYIARKQNLDIYKSFDLICFDGVLFVRLIRFLWNVLSPRISFDMTSLAPEVFSFISKTDKSIYFIGSTQDNILKFITNIRDQYPNMKIAGFRNGYFKKKEKYSFFKEIESLSPNVVVVGMGTPNQDILIAELKNILTNTSLYSCGGFFHQSGKGVKYYPKWIDRLNLRWLYRMYDEPILLKRYFRYYPVGVFLFLKDGFNRK
jgi:N-acetylglucosaminyldiphosphoundecaprenol N-acetyl-beta-D-mannosaminyltransferase